MSLLRLPFANTLTIGKTNGISPISSWLRLSRLSSLPTVWANVFTGVALASKQSTAVNTDVVFYACVAMSFAYLVGMFLNDVFDAQFDKRFRKERPIANGEVSIKSVTIMTIVFILSCLFLMFYAAANTGQSSTQALFSTVALFGCIILYNASHKSNPLSPVVMGACRALIYTSCALLASSALPLPVLIAAVLLWCYVIGTNYMLKQGPIKLIQDTWPVAVLIVPLTYTGYLTWNNPVAAVPFVIFASSVVSAIYLFNKRRPGDVPIAAVMLISAMALIDSILLFTHGFPELAIAALACWFSSALLQSWSLSEQPDCQFHRTTNVRN